MKHLFLIEMRNNRIITTPEYMVLYNFHFRNFQEYKNFCHISIKKLRELYKGGLNKIIKYNKKVLCK